MSTNHADTTQLWARPDFVARRIIDLRCREFEDAWHQDLDPTIERFSNQIAAADRDQLIRELIAVEWELRTDRGEVLNRNEYEARFPSVSRLFSELDEPIRTQNPQTRLPDYEWQLKPGDQFGDFRIIRELGRGAMGVVYLSEIPAIQHQVALKILRSELSEQTTLKSRFEREARILAQLDHPHIVPLYSYGIHNGHPYLVMKAIHGASLSEVLFAANAASLPGTRLRQPSGPDRNALVYSICVQLAKALEYSHAQGVLHRDIKPSNILLDQNLQVFLTDLSLARSDAVDANLTAHDEFVGTLQYAAPESLDGIWNPQTDLYSLGLVLLEICTLQPAFRTPTRRQLLQQKLNPTSLRSALACEEIPSALRPIIERLTAFLPEQRFASAIELVQTLETVDLTKERQVRNPKRLRLALSAATGSVLTMLFVLRYGVHDSSESVELRSNTSGLNAPAAGNESNIVTLAKQQLEIASQPSLITPSPDGSFALIASESNILRWDIKQNRVFEIWSRPFGDLVALDVSTRNDIVACYRDIPAALNEQRPVSNDGFVYDLVWHSHHRPEFTGAVIPQFDSRLSRVIFSPGDSTSFPPYFFVPNLERPVILDVDRYEFIQTDDAVHLLTGWNSQIVGITSEGDLISMDSSAPAQIRKRRPSHISSPSTLHFVNGGQSLFIANTETFRTDLVKNDQAGDAEQIPSGYSVFLPDRHIGRWIVFSNNSNLRIFDIEQHKWVPKPITITSKVMVADLQQNQDGLLIVEQNGLIRLFSASSGFEQLLDSRKLPELVSAKWSNLCNQLACVDTQGQIWCLTTTAPGQNAFVPNR